MAKYAHIPNEDDQPVLIRKTNEAYEKLLGRTYRKHELIIFFREQPKDREVEVVRQSFKKDGIDPASIEIVKCDNCALPVQLWRARNIHTVINTEGVKVGSGPATTTVGETYSLNFINSFPEEEGARPGRKPYPPDAVDDQKEKVIVAVLDTGLDTRLVDSRYIWQAKPKRTDPKCYQSVSSGWNFLNDTDDFRDDNPGRHGSIVSQYIINQFKNSPRYGVQIMPLKTHDKKGTGDLFHIICAIHFAMAKGAHIINASWGFYYYYALPIPYLQELITVTLRNRGILFVTAAGNKDEAEEVIARQIYLQEQGVPITADQLRNLALHHFYPARLSAETNGVVTVTTTNGKTVSPTQNYSRLHADLGVLADKASARAMQFRLPFAGSGAGDLVSGSSFATAIASGIIGAYCDKSLYAPGLAKRPFLDALAAQAGAGGIAGLYTEAAALEKKYIRKGAYTKKMG